jgi:hypothetical protein
MKKRVSISLELSGDSLERRYDSLDRWLRRREAVQVMPTQWILLTPLTVEEVRRELQGYIDPADRLLVTQVASMSSRNLINSDVLGKGAA